MGEESVMGSKVKGLYKKLCKDEWNSVTAGIIVAFLSVLILVWARPWGAVGAMRNWGEWIIYGLGFWDKINAGEILEILGTDPGSRNDLPGWCTRSGHIYLGEKEDSGFIRFYLQKK